MKNTKKTNEELISETAFHFIAITKINGSRIAWHYSKNGRLDKDVMMNFFDRTEEVLGDCHFGIHKLSTGNTSWESVVEKDSWFKDIISTKDLTTFLNIMTHQPVCPPTIKKDRSDFVYQLQQYGMTTDMYMLPVGQKFSVANGEWSGYITLINEKKHMHINATGNNVPLDEQTDYQLVVTLQERG